WGDGSIVRDFVNVKDIARLYYLCTISSGCNGIYNAGSGIGISLRELISVMSAELNITPHIVKQASRGFDVATIVLNNDKARTTFDWSPRISLNVGLQELAYWLNATDSRKVKRFTKVVGI